MSSEAAPARDYAGESGSERVQRRRGELIAAALDLADSDGWRRVTVDRIARHAKLSKRYFYENFADLDALASAVVDHIAGGLQEAATTAYDPGLPVPQLAQAVIDAIVRYLTDDPCRARVLFGELAVSEAAAAHQTRAIRGIAAFVGTIARDVHHATGAHDPIIETTASLLVGGTGQVILDWISNPHAATREQLIDDLTALWIITGDGAAAHAKARASR